MKLYNNAVIFYEIKFEKLKKDNFYIRMVGHITLTLHETEALKLNPKFAVVERLDSEDMEVESEMGMTKYRYQITKKDEVLEYIEDDLIRE